MLGRVKRFLLLAAAVATGCTAPVQAEPGWTTDFKQAQEQAKGSQKLVLLDFTGSDWCGWCMRLRREVFSKPEFKDYASKNLVLVELDFPRNKQLPVDLQRQNLELAEQFQVQGFPTIIVLNGAGKIVGELGYVEGGASAFIAELEKLRKS